MSLAVSAAEVDVAFRCLLGRSPEDERTSLYFQGLKSIDDVIYEIKLSKEAQDRAPAPSPFWNFNSNFDAKATIRAHEDKARKSIPGRIVNFLGVIVNPKIYPPILHGQEGRVEELPMPSNWHADIAEFAAALRAVDLAKETFRVVELGCGWGCWLLNTGVAARNKGLKVDLIGVEGDDGHVAFAKEITQENGFDANETRIIRGIVGPKEGSALFPKQSLAGASWGLEPIFDATRAQIAGAGDQYDVLPVVTLQTLAKDGKSIDLVHMDIQGGEAVFVKSCIEELSRLVAYVVIGTHSREIEGEIIQLMLAHGWALEMERPAIFSLEGGRPTTLCDGVQGWRNPRLRASP